MTAGMKKATTTVKTEAEKQIDKVASTKAKVAEDVKEVKEAVKTVMEEVKEEVKAAPAKVEAVKEEVKSPVKRTRKAAAKKTETPKEADKKPVEANVILQFECGEFDSEDLVKRCIKAYEAENKTKIKSIDVYIKPADGKAYYVVNKKSAGYVDLV